MEEGTPTAGTPRQHTIETARGTPPARDSSLREDPETYASAVKSLTNYEVWKNVESSMLNMMPNQDVGAEDWRHFRILLEELRWRLSGLEGVGTSTKGLPVTLRTS